MAPGRGEPAPVSGEQKDVLFVAKGGGFLAMGDLFTYAIRLGLSIALARWLGADSYGLYILTVSVTFIVAGIASLGLDSSMERYVPIQLRRGDHAGVRGTLRVGVIGTVVASLLLAVGLAVLAEPLAQSLFDDERMIDQLRIAALFAPVLAFSTLLVATLRGFKRIDLSAFGDDVVQPVSRLVITLVIALTGITAFGASIAFGLSYLAAVIVMLRLLRRPYPVEMRQGERRSEIRSLAAFSFPFWVSGLLRRVRTNLQSLLLVAFGAVAGVGVFSVVTSANMLGRVANASISTAVRPVMAEQLDRQDHDAVSALFKTTTRWTLTVSLPVLLILVLMPEAILGLFGEGFTVGTTALVVVAAAELANAATGICGSVIDMSGQNRLKLINSFVFMGISVGFNVALIPTWGVNGAAVAILVSTVAVNAIRVGEIWMLYRALPWDRGVLKPVGAAAITAVVAILALAALPEVGLVLLVVVSAGIVALFAGLITAFGFEEDDRLVLDRLGASLARRFGRSRRSNRERKSGARPEEDG